MLNYESLRLINNQIKIYSDFPLPVLICDMGFQVYWSNRLARELFPRFSEPDGLLGILSELNLEALLSDIAVKGGVTLSGIIPISDVSVRLSPILSGSPEPAGITAILISSLGIPMPSSETGRAAAAFADGMRGHADGIFSAVDSAYLKSLMLDEALWLSPHLNQITSGAYSLLRMSANFTEYSRLQSGAYSYSFRAVDIFAWLRGISEAVEVIAKKAGIPAAFDIEDGAAFVRVDLPSFETAFFNVVNNALFFTRENNRVVISAFDSGNISIMIKDHGLGMDDETKRDAFKPFFARANAAGARGAGLGLTLAGLVVKAHGGELAVESSLGSGTSVTLSLPPLSFSRPIPFEQGSSALDSARLAVRDRFSALHIGLMGIAGNRYD